MLTWSHHQIFWRFFISLVKFSYWSKFHVNINIGSEVMAIFFYKRLTTDLEIGNSTIWVSSNILRLRQVRNTKFCTNVSNKMLLNAAKCQSCSFYRFWVIKGKPTLRVKLSPLTQMKVKALPNLKISQEWGNKNIKIWIWNNSRNLKKFRWEIM